MQTLRKDLELFVPKGSSHNSNLGLKLDKLNREIDSEEREHDAKDKALAIMEAFKPNEDLQKAYKYSFEQWQNSMKAQNDTECFEIKAITKVLLGTGNASIFEFGFNLSKPYGVPYISGSSLKGLVSAYLAKNGGPEWFKSNKNTEKSQFQVQLFGGKFENSDYIGSVNFYDARLILSSQKWFVQDIITTHHQKYYGGHRLPDGTENPIPIKITALDAGLKFFVVLKGPKRDRFFIKNVLIEALKNDGIGGKTAVGYGRFEYVVGEAEKNEKIKFYSNEQILELNTSSKLGENNDFDNAVRFALEANEIEPTLKEKYKKYCPFRYMLLKLQNENSIDALKLDKHLKRNLNKYPNPKSSEDGKAIFLFAFNNLKLIEQDWENNSVLSQCPTPWEESVFTNEEIEEFIFSLTSISSAELLKSRLENSSLSSKKDLLDLINMQLEELGEMNNE